MDGARAADLSLKRVAQPGAGEGMGLHLFDPDGEATDGRADVSFDSRRAGPGDAGVGEVRRPSIPEAPRSVFLRELDDLLSLRRT